MSLNLADGGGLRDVVICMVDWFSTSGDHNFCRSLRVVQPRDGFAERMSLCRQRSWTCSAASWTSQSLMDAWPW